MSIGNLFWRWPWLPVLALVLSLVFGLLVCHMAHRRKPNQETGARVWTLKSDLDTEDGHEALRRWRGLNRIAAILLCLALLMALSLAARPARVDRTLERGHNRDIVLCLDVSGSTLPYDRQVIASYLDLVRNFRGERMALSIFNSTSRTVFPLTDDYDMITAELSKARRILDGVQSQDRIDAMSGRQYQDISDWLEGTQNRRDTTSLIGDGLVGCAALLPQFAPKDQSGSTRINQRSSSLVLATDNVVSGKPTYTLGEALKLAAAAGIAVDGLYSGPEQGTEDESTKQMQQLIEAHGGVFLRRQDGNSINALVRQIEYRHGAEPRQQEQSSLVDAPGWWTLALALALSGYLLLAWRLKR
ncbi:vWA domain-containing protein [Bifidobacterium asteroides]|uniref:VWA domain-containing protein n=1 Tax=Bifidobacterium asteroides TaxID=1684 RepID=A0A318M423_9BIFI|nr:VWA domain-containing protein [Bifidobacterium asteroides]PXY82156.1 VWA domain-containing protein [Bifidobacterium asteroides]